MTRLWIRADGTPGVGLGHVMRTVALAEAATDHGISTVMLLEPGAGATAAAARGCDVGPPDFDLTHLGPDDIVVFDGYGFDQRDIDGASGTGAVVALVDDVGQRDLVVDTVINQNPVPQGAYRRARYALLGPTYALVRSEFLRRRRARGDALTSVVVTLGGGGVPPVVHDVIAALTAVAPTFDVRLVVGPAGAAPQVPDVPWLHVIAAPDDVAAVFDADAAIAAAGSTTWELLAMGVPTLLVQTATNQEHVIRGAAAAGAALSAGGADGDLAARVASGLEHLLDPRTRSTLSAAALDLVDGHGAARVVEHLTHSR